MLALCSASQKSKGKILQNFVAFSEYMNFKYIYNGRLQGSSNMEEMFSRFPHLGEAIMDQLDNTALTDSRLVDRIWSSFIDNQKLPWMRIIFEWTAYNNQEWQEISRKLNVEMLKILAKTVNQLLKGQ